MKVSCLEHEGPFEIDKKDMTMEITITEIKCPICKGDAYLKEIDVYVCSNCGLVWSVHYDFADYSFEKGGLAKE